MSELEQELLRATPPPVRAELEAEPGSIAVDELVQRAHQAHPGVDVPSPVFAAHLGARLGAAAELHSVHAEDLYLACACVYGDAVALSRFEDRFGKDIDRGLAKLSGGADADRQQVVRARLLVGDDEQAPKLASYKGRGELLHWLRVTVVRMRADFARAPKRADSPSKEEPHVSRVMGPRHDPEFQYLKEHYGGVLKEAFEAALVELEPKQRNLLRQHLVDGLSTRQLAGLYNVDRTTVGRWVARARDELWKHTRREIMLKLKVDRAEFDSIVRLVRSQLDVSVARLLKS